MAWYDTAFLNRKILLPKIACNIFIASYVHNACMLSHKLVVYQTAVTSVDQTKCREGYNIKLSHQKQFIHLARQVMLNNKNELINLHRAVDLSHKKFGRNIP